MPMREDEEEEGGRRRQRHTPSLSLGFLNKCIPGSGSDEEQ
jgi:hypothetical protein